MVISVTPTPEETLALASDTLKLAKEIGDRVDNMKVEDRDFFELKAARQKLIADVMKWTSEGIALATGNVGQAVDAINGATAAMKKANDTVKKIAADIDATLAFVNLAEAISTGNPAAIVSTGATFIAKAKAIA